MFLIEWYLSGGLIYQEGVRGQSIWTFDEAKLVIARVGSNAFTTKAENVYDYIAKLAGTTSGDAAMFRTFYQIAAYFTNMANDNGGRSKKSKTHKSTKRKEGQGSQEKNIFQK